MLLKCTLTSVELRAAVLISAVAVLWLFGTLAYAQSSSGAAGGKLTVASLKLLSERGSTRATFYIMSNKTVTLQGKTHVSWLDGRSDTMIATYDHATGTWTKPVKVGTGTDNHGGPALACDSKGYLHIVFGPHGGPLQHCRSAQPNDSTKWVKLPDFAVNATYPTLVCDKYDTLHVAYRGGSSFPLRLMYQRRPKGGSWNKSRALAEAPGQGYTNYDQMLAIGADNTLHLAYSIYPTGRAGHMMSKDRGKTWTLADGSRPELPVKPSSSKVFLGERNQRVAIAGIACDSKGRPWLSANVEEKKEGKKTWSRVLYYHNAKKWHSVKPRFLVPPNLQGGLLGIYGPMSIDSKDRVYLPATIGKSVRGGILGHVVVFYSVDGGKKFQAASLFPPHDSLPHRGLNIERPTGHHFVEVPWLLFSTGKKGKGNADWDPDVANTVRVVQLAWK